jgi:hypothetical protein
VGGLCPGWATRCFHRHLRGSTRFYIPFSDGSKYNLRQLGSYYGIHHLDRRRPDLLQGLLWPAIPHTDNVNDYLAEGSFGGSLLTSDPMGMTFGPTLGTGAAILKATIGGVESWPLATSPLGGGTRPYQSRWDYYHQLEGFEIDQLDLDGIDHSPAYVQPVGRKPISMAAKRLVLRFSPTLGPSSPSTSWTPGSTPAYPCRDQGRRYRRLGGDYAIDSDLHLNTSYPSPTNVVPREAWRSLRSSARRDHPGRKEVFRRRARAWSTCATSSWTSPLPARRRLVVPGRRRCPPLPGLLEHVRRRRTTVIA